MVMSFYLLSFMLLKVLFVIDHLLKLPTKKLGLDETSTYLNVTRTLLFQSKLPKPFLSYFFFFMLCSLLIGFLLHSLKIKHPTKYYMIPFLILIFSKCFDHYSTHPLFNLIEPNLISEQEIVFSYATSQVLKALTYLISILEKSLFLDISLFMIIFYLICALLLQILKIESICILLHLFLSPYIHN